MAAKFTSEHAVYRALRNRFKAPEYAVLPGVRNATGYGQSREIDALMMGLWPSRGLHLHGVEIKVSRSDWLRELRNPNKQEAIFKYCDRFWLAVGDASIVKPDELPDTWGLLVPHGKALKIRKKAPDLEGGDLSRPFLAAILRRVDEVKMDPALEREIRKELQEHYQEKLTESHEYLSRALDAEGKVKVLEAKLEACIDFEERSGLRFHRYQRHRLHAVADLVKALRHQADSLSLDAIVQQLGHARTNVARVLDTTDKAIEAVTTYRQQTEDQAQPSEETPDEDHLARK